MIDFILDSMMSGHVIRPIFQVMFGQTYYKVSRKVNSKFGSSNFFSGACHHTSPDAMHCFVGNMTSITKRIHEEVTVMNCLKPKQWQTDEMMFNTFILKYNLLYTFLLTLPWAIKAH